MTTIPTERLEGLEDPERPERPGRSDRSKTPKPPSIRRSPMMMVSGVLLITIGMLISAGVYINLNKTQMVIAVVAPVQRGQQITHADLTTAQIGFDPMLKPMPASEISAVVGQYATVDLLPGTFLTEQAVGTRITPGPDQAEVGIALIAGQFPNDGLKPGDKVELVRIPEPSSPNLPDKGYPGMIATITINGTNMIGTIIVSQEDARAVSVLAASSKLALILTARG